MSALDIVNLISNYKSARNKLRKMIERTNELLFVLSDSRVENKVTNDFIEINRELSELRDKTIKRSKYLNNVFSGLSMIPIPIVSNIFNVVGFGSDKISEFIESAQWANRGFTPNGLSAYYAFLESIVDHRKIESFPEVEQENSALAPNFIVTHSGECKRNNERF